MRPWSLDSTTARLIPDSEYAGSPFWSPDSKSIAFFNTAKLQRIDVAGGTPQTICDAVGLPGGGEWLRENQIVFGLLDSALFRVASSGGMPAPLTALDSSRGEMAHYWPQILPGGRLLYWIRSNQPEHTGVYISALAKPAERIKLLSSEANAIYATASDGGYLLWFRGDTLVAQRFEASNLKVSGEPHPISTPVSKIRIMGRLNASVGAGGLLLYSALGSTLAQFTWFDRSGKLLGSVGDPDDYSTFRLSSDGRRVVASCDRAGGTDLFLIDIGTRLSSRLTVDSNVNVFPIWSPNNRNIIFRSTRYLFRTDTERASTEESVIPSQKFQYATDWSGDGRLVLYNELSGETQEDLGIWRVTPDGKAEPGASPSVYLSTPFNEDYGRFLPEPSPAVGCVSNRTCPASTRCTLPHSGNTGRGVVSRQAAASIHNGTPMDASCSSWHRATD
jgi:hypothetical protein